MSIKEILKKIKLIWRPIVIALIFGLVGLSSFGLGQLSMRNTNREEITIKKLEIPILATLTADPSSQSVASKGILVGSKTGQKYHLPDCPGAKQISEQNKIWFSSYDEAKALGYTPAGNCKGLAR